MRRCCMIWRDAAENGCVDVKFKFADILSACTATNGADRLLADALNSAGIEVTLSSHYKREAFRKAILNTALGTVCAITRLTMQEVMQRPDLHRMVKEIVREVHKIIGVNKLHHIHVWHLNDEELHLEAHLDCSEDIKMSEFNILLEKVEIVLFEKFHINHINIQPEFKKEDPKDFIVQD